MIRKCGRCGKYARHQSPDPRLACVLCWHTFTPAAEPFLQAEAEYNCRVSALYVQARATGLSPDEAMELARLEAGPEPERITALMPRD